MTELPLPLEDLSAFVISGRVKSHLSEPPEFETSVRTPAQGLADAAEAERLGYHRVFIAERPELKEPGALLGGIGALTSRIGLGTGIIAVGSRHPMLLASLGATMQAAYGPRFTLGIGRGAHYYGHGGHLGLQAFADYGTIIKRIWAGEQFEYDGPAGSFGKLGLADWYEGPAPDILCGAFGLPQSAEMIAATASIDGLLLPAMVTPNGVARAAGNIRTACERVGRDPKELRIVVEVVTAPDLSDGETRQLAHARAVTYLQPEVWARSYARLNNWDVDVIQQMREHPQFSSVGGGLVDLTFHRRQLAGPAGLIPDEWMADACALGTVDDCVRKLQEFRDAGADEIATYGSTPGQNAELVTAWRTRSTEKTPHRAGRTAAPATPAGL
jgi:5,10-methylenetetrahydromethanopterin reductase